MTTRIYPGPPAGSSTPTPEGRPCPPGIRWSPLAYSAVIGICAASAFLWVLLIASVLGMVGEYLATQADIAVKLAQITAGPGACPDAGPPR